MKAMRCGETTLSHEDVVITKQLVEAGKVDLDAPVTTYLPWFRTNDASASLARLSTGRSDNFHCGAGALFDEHRCNGESQG